MQTKRLETRIMKLKTEISEIGEMRPGSLSQQYSACQKRGCKCVDSVKPKKHGPFHQLSYSHRGKSTTQFIRPQFLTQVRSGNRNAVRGFYQQMAQSYMRDGDVDKNLRELIKSIITADGASPALKAAAR